MTLKHPTWPLRSKRFGQELIELIIVVLPMALMVFALFWIGGGFVAAVSTSNAARRPMENRMAYADAIGGATPSGTQPIFNEQLEQVPPGAPSASHTDDVHALIVSKTTWAAPSPMFINGFSNGIVFYGVQLIDGKLLKPNTPYGGQQGSMSWSPQGMELLNPEDYGLIFNRKVEDQLNMPVFNRMASAECGGGDPTIDIDFVNASYPDEACGPNACYEMEGFLPIYHAPRAGINFFYSEPSYLKDIYSAINSYPFDLDHRCDTVSEQTIKDVMARRKAEAQNQLHPPLYKHDSILNICEYTVVEANKEVCGSHSCGTNNQSECANTCPVKHSDDSCLTAGVDRVRTACKVQLINKFFRDTLRQMDNYHACESFSDGKATKFAPNPYTY